MIVIISYEPLYKTLKEKNISTYKLIKQYNISRSLLDRLKHDKPISTVTLNDLCTILDCKVEDVLVFKKDNKKEKGVQETTHLFLWKLVMKKYLEINN